MGLPRPPHQVRGPRNDHILLFRLPARRRFSEGRDFDIRISVTDAGTFLAEADIKEMD